MGPLVEAPSAFGVPFWVAALAAGVSLAASCLVGCDANSPLTAGAAVAGVPPEEAGCEALGAAGVPKSDEVGFVAAALAEDCAFPNKPLGVDAAGAADDVGVEVAGLPPPNKPAAEPVVALDVGGAGVLPNSPAAGAGVVVAVAAGAAGLLAPKSPPAVAVAALAGDLVPNRAVPLLGGLLPVFAAPKMLGAGVVVEAAGAAAGFDASVGGAPAGVVDAAANMGFAGVAAAAAGCAPPVLFPKSELPVLAKGPAAGAPDVEGVGWLGAAVLSEPNRPPPPVLEPPAAAAPNRLGVGLLAVSLDVPKRPPAGGAAVPVLPPEKAPVAGVAFVAGADDGLDAPNRPPADEGVVELPAPNRPLVAGVVVLVPEAAPNKLEAAGFCASPLPCAPKTEAVLLVVAGVDVLLPSEAPPNEAKENFGAPVAGTEPKSPPAAGADVFALDCSPDELGVPKLNAMAAVTGDEAGSRVGAGIGARGLAGDGSERGRRNCSLTEPPPWHSNPGKRVWGSCPTAVGETTADQSRFLATRSVCLGGSFFPHGLGCSAVLTGAKC